jgi:hypothetical protein
MQMNKDGNTQGVSLLLTLSPQDADLLRAAVPAAPIPRDGLGIKATSSLAQTALGAIARALLGQGYQAQPLSAEMRTDGTPDRVALPPGVVRVQFGSTRSLS